MWLRALIALAMVDLPWQCPAAPPTAPPTTPSPATTAPKHETGGHRVTTAPPPDPPRRAITLPEGAIVRALDTVSPSFLRCFARTRAADPTLGRLKVTLHLDIDETGAVVAAVADETTRAATPKLALCLTLVARSMRFAAPGQPAVVDVPLLD